MNYQMRCYIAAPFFNDVQIECVEEIKKILTELEIRFFSPKDECLYVPGGKVQPADAFNDNITAILGCDCLIAVTDDKDPGTMFEAGLAFANRVPIVYVWLTGTTGKFNLMLSESASAIAYSYADLRRILTYYKKNFRWPKFQKGDIE